MAARPRRDTGELRSGLGLRLTAAAADGIDAFIDLFGPEYVQLAVALGIPRNRIQTIIAFQVAHLLGTRSESSESVSNRYSFKDDPVNAALRAEFIDRDAKPRVLVVTYGGELRRRAVERAFGWGIEDGSSRKWLTINRGGANGVETSNDWRDFIK